MYIFSPEFVDDIAARLTGPLNFRFILQPMAAILLGMRDGSLDEPDRITPRHANQRPRRVSRGGLSVRSS